MGVVPFFALLEGLLVEAATGTAGTFFVTTGLALFSALELAADSACAVLMARGGASFRPLLVTDRLAAGLVTFGLTDLAGGLTDLAGKALTDLAFADDAELGFAVLPFAFAALATVATVLTFSLGLALFERAAIPSSFR